MDSSVLVCWLLSPQNPLESPVHSPCTYVFVVVQGSLLALPPSLTIPPYLFSFFLFSFPLSTQPPNQCTSIHILAVRCRVYIPNYFGRWHYHSHRYTIMLHCINMRIHRTLLFRANANAPWDFSFLFLSFSLSTPHVKSTVIFCINIFKK